jgi:hypothetical protein
MSEVRVCVWSNERTEVQAVAEGRVGGIMRVGLGAEFDAVCFGDVGADGFEPTIDASKLILNV